MGRKRTRQGKYFLFYIATLNHKKNLYQHGLMKKKILIYDDDEEILMLCKAILSRYDFDVETLSMCENIIADIERFNPHVVLMDLWIPQIGGERAIEILKEHENTRHTPVLIFSANANIKDISKKVNANGFIEKPFSVSNFVETIQNHLL